MSLLSETTKTVVGAHYAANSQILLGDPTLVVGGINYETIVCTPIVISTPLATNDIVLLTDAATGKPISIKGKLILYTIYEATSLLLSAAPTLSNVGIVTLISPTDFSLPLDISNTYANVVQINDKYIVEESNYVQSNYYFTENTNYFLGLQSHGTVDITGGTISITFQLVSLAI